MLRARCRFRVVGLLWRTVLVGLVGCAPRAEYEAITDRAEQEYADAERGIERLRQAAEANAKQTEEELRDAYLAGEESIGSPQAVAWLEVLTLISGCLPSDLGAEEGERPGSPVEAVNCEFSDDLARWLQSLPKEALQRMRPEDAKDAPKGSGWVIRVEMAPLTSSEAQGDVPRAVAELLDNLQSRCMAQKPPADDAPWISHATAVRGAEDDDPAWTVAFVWRPEDSGDREDDELSRPAGGGYPATREADP